MTRPIVPVASGISGSTLKIGTIAAGLYLVVLPFNGLAAAKNLCLAIAFVCALLLWFRSSEKRIPLVSMFLVWLAAATASLLWSHDVSASLSAIWRDVVKTSLVFFAFFVLADRQASPIVIMRIATIGALAFAGLAIYDFSQGRYWQNFLTPALYDVSVDAMNWLVFLGTLIALNGAREPRRPSHWPWPTVVAGGLLLVAGLMTHSRSFNLALVLVVAVLAALNSNKLRAHRAGLAVAAGVVGAVGIVAAFMLGKPLGTYWDRVWIYTTTWQKISDNFWLGTGFGHETDQAWYLEVFGNPTTSPYGSLPMTHPHNLILSYMDQMGVWGLLALVFMFWAIGRELWLALRSGRPLQVRLGQAGMLLLLVTLIFNTFNFYFARQHLWMFFGMLGLLLGWIRVDRRASQ